MPLKKGFTLIELMLVIILMSLFYFLSIKFIAVKKNVQINQLYMMLYPNGRYDISKLNCKTYNYYDANLKEIKKNFYSVKDGVGDSFLMECDNKIYLFRPFDIKEYNSTDEAIESMSNFLNEGIN